MTCTYHAGDLVYELKRAAEPYDPTCSPQKLAVSLWSNQLQDPVSAARGPRLEECYSCWLWEAMADRGEHVVEEKGRSPA